MSVTAATLIGWSVVNATPAGYQAPTVTVSSALPRRKGSGTVLIVPVAGADDGATVLGAEPYLDDDHVAAIESTLEALGATGAPDQIHRFVVPSLPVASVLTIGLGPVRDSW